MEAPDSIAVTYFSDDEISTETDSFFMNDVKYRRKHGNSRSHRILVLLWILVTIFLVFLSLILLFKVHQLQSIASYESGFKTDFAPLKPVIGIVEQRFTGGLKLDKAGKWYRSNTTTPQYVGTPNEAIDGAWNKLLAGVEIIVSGGEAETISSETIEEREGGSYRLSLDMHYSLHCVANLVRKEIDFEYYYPSGKIPYFYRDHIDDCIDYLRQTIQCHGDMTPLTYYRHGGGTVPIFGATHTCRNFNELDNWALERRPSHAA
ncbi:hypothetical protein N431DRAFT_473866 [Stipitochalara longipes BDJ]|nr:hypothetical protein N431DRAFT_473866 [Stipitochalara longipes BDJ]